MHPILIDLGPLTIHTYGLMVALAFLAAIWWGGHEARLAGLKHEIVPDLALLILIAAIVGARLVYVLIELPRFLNTPLKMLMFWEGGLVFSGGLALAVPAGWWAVRRHNQPPLPWCDAAAPAIALGQAIGRLGCLGAGCCYGKPTTLPWGITFHAEQSLAPQNISLHPTQIYHALAALLCFGVLVLLRQRLPRPGQRLGLYLVMFPVLRFIIEFFRDDHRGTVGPISLTQLMAGIFLSVGLWLLFHQPKGEQHDH
jgi:phosphatidylglycerol:prolipoprotein diacylglycerol transferase